MSNKQSDKIDQIIKYTSDNQQSFDFLMSLTHLSGMCQMYKRQYVINNALRRDYATPAMWLNFTTHHSIMDLTNMTEDQIDLSRFTRNETMSEIIYKEIYYTILFNENNDDIYNYIRRNNK